MINLFIHTGGKKLEPQLVEYPEAVEYIIIDLFCGAGGTTSGFSKAINKKGQPIAIIAAAVNHDPKAIESHWRNHPEVVHFEEDIRTLDLGPLKALIEAYRILYPKAKIILWGSLECTNFSKAKGGQPRDADSRTLADHLPRYITALNPDYVQIENVVEFMSWGPLDKNGKPVSKRSGSDWLRWRESVNSLGYRDEWKELNSADFGSYTSRNRLFGCFAKKGLPIIWPEATHAKNPQKAGLFGALKKWMPVKEVLDFEDEGVSIFNRKKPLSPKTLERIYAGLIKYVAGGKDAFLVRYNSVGSDGGYKQTATDIDKPCPTVSTQNRLGMAFIQKHFSGKPEGKVVSLDGPTGTITTTANQSLVQCFIAKYYGSGGQLNSIDEPASCITRRENLSKIHLRWIDKYYSGTQNHQSVEGPAGVVMPNDKHNLIQAQPFIMVTNFNNVGRSVDEPAPTLVASRRHHYIVNPSHGGHSTSTDKPCPVIIARQDKAPLYLVQTVCGSAFIPIYEDDPDILVDIKVFMCLYGISDIKMRMLKVLELLRIQGFPANYILVGNQTDQKKFIGNSVEPKIPKVWIEAFSRYNLN